MVAVRWCEAEVRDFEWTNTASNLVFLVAAYEGWRVAKKKRLPVEFVVAEWLLVVVFVGSVLFHGTAPQCRDAPEPSNVCWENQDAPAAQLSA